MKRYLLKVGDKSTTGGIVIEGVDSCTHHGTALTFVGAQVVCNACESTGVIAAQGPRWPDHMMGKEQALDGDLCLCKCHPPPVMIASQTDSFHSFESHNLAEMGYGPSGQSLTEEYRGNCDERVRVLDGNNQPVCSSPYHIRTSAGAVYKGLTDSQGYCPRVYTKDVSKLDIAVGLQALERWEQ
ncbi:PAAR domain-containing protein [Burkholderia sp. A9]|uniref:PAAR domain-containing protein n=1 Tax=Burkholderia sp. A9 TaxID=1365108 RepID=UPI0012699DD4|nr:PAAR domain-containing protein [Burkholderia sp. A9]